MAALTVQQATLAGITPTYNAASASDTFVNNGKTFITVVNGGASPDTVGVNSLTNCDFGTDHDISVAVTNGTTRIFGPFDTRRFNDQNGAVTVTHSYTTSVTVAVVSL